MPLSFKTVEQAIELAKMSEHENERSFAFWQIGRMLVAVDEIDKAAEVSKLIESPIRQSLAISRIAPAMARSGDMKSAKELLDEYSKLYWLFKTCVKPMKPN